MAILMTAPASVALNVTRPSPTAPVGSGWVIGAVQAPLFLKAKKMTPGGSEGISVLPGGIGSLGMFGHPSTPPTISPSSMSASAMAYCLLFMNPFVPSMGSRIQYLPDRDGSVLPPRSMASATSSLNMSRTMLPSSGFSFSESALRITLFTRDVTRSSSGAFASPRRSSALSSATIWMSGWDSRSTLVTMHCAAKSATVTGESSLLLTFSPLVSVRWVSTQTMDARRTASHAARISSGKCLVTSSPSLGDAVATAEGIRGRFGERRRAETPGAVGRWVVDARRDAEAMARRPSATDVDLTSRSSESHHISHVSASRAGGDGGDGGRPRPDRRGDRARGRPQARVQAPRLLRPARDRRRGARGRPVALPRRGGGGRHRHRRSPASSRRKRRTLLQGGRGAPVRGRGVARGDAEGRAQARERGASPRTVARG